MKQQHCGNDDEITINDDEQLSNEEEEEETMKESEMNDEELKNSLKNSSIEIKLKNLNSTIYLIGVCYFQVLKGSIKILGKNISSHSKSYFLNSNCIYGMIGIENTNQESLIKFYIPNKSNEKEYDLYKRCFYLHKNLQIFNNQKLEKSKRKLESLYIYGNSNIPSHLIKFDFANDFIKRVVNRCNRKELRKYLICGHALSGKSIFSNYLMNELLNYYPKVAFLNLNINSPICGVRGTLSLTIHKSPTFGPLFQSNENFKIIYQIYHGHSTTDLQFETFLKQTLELYQIYCKSFSNIPLIINTQSLLPSSGYQIILELCQIFNISSSNLLNYSNPNQQKQQLINNNNQQLINNNTNLDLIILSNYKNPNINPSPSGSIDYNTLNNNTTFLMDQLISGENTSIVDLRNLETLFLIESKQGYRNHYFSKINLQYLYYFSYCYNIEEFTRIFDLVFTKNNQILLEKNKVVECMIVENSKSIYEFFSELPTIKLKFNELIITLLNADSSELSNGLYYLNGSFVGVYTFDISNYSQSENCNQFHSKLKSNSINSEYPLMTIKTSRELKTQLKCIGLVKKVCPYEKVIYLSIPKQQETEFKIHHLTVGSCVFDFNPEDYCKQTMNQPYFQSKSMTIDRGEVLQNAHRLKLQKQRQQHYKN